MKTKQVNELKVSAVMAPGRHPWTGRPSLAHPLLPAFLSRSRETFRYACPWCGGQHRHRAKGARPGSLTNRQQHCREWRRLYPREGWDAVYFRIYASDERAIAFFLVAEEAGDAH